MFTRPDHGGFWACVDHVPIRKIRIDKRLMSWPNDICLETCKEIAHRFDRGLWIPVTVNEDYFLLDGQHRLKAAKLMRLKYIDVVVQKNDFGPNATPAVRQKKRVRVPG